MGELAGYILPALAAVILLRCAVSMLAGRPAREVWGWVTLPGGRRVELTAWENQVGRSRASDVWLDRPGVSRTHGAFVRDSRGDWRVCDFRSRTGVTLRGKRVSGSAAIRSGETVLFGAVPVVFTASSVRSEREQAKSRPRPGSRVSPAVTLLLLTVFVALLGLRLWFVVPAGDRLSVAVAFTGLAAAVWASYAVTRGLDRTGFEPETLAFMLTALGLALICASDPGAAPKQLLCALIGVVLCFLLGLWLREPARVRAMGAPTAIFGVGLLLVNLLTAKSIFGAKNWLRIGGISFQPSELVKICFVFAGSAELDRLYARRNLLSFILLSAACVGCLGAMSDFGTAAVFFAAYIVIAFMRSGSFATVLLSLAGTGLGVFTVVTARPYVMARFAAWGHVWEDPSGAGYQQTRALAAAASGGLFGLGPGRGRLDRVFAADTDMVFPLMCEELGLITAVIAVLSVLLLAVFAVRCAGEARGARAAIAACGAVTVLTAQLILNVFGSVDLLPFTGVTFPFVSKGGTGMIAAWGLLAFLKAADTRQNASFAIALDRRERKRGGGRG